MVTRRHSTSKMKLVIFLGVKIRAVMQHHDLGLTVSTELVALHDFSPLRPDGGTPVI